jgi:microcystin-dependent protein
MEGYMAEIRMFAANFAPRNWQYCAGQLLAISTNTALFSLLGTTYGGNGQTTFGLPDLRGRVAVGTGSGGTAGITVQQGQMSGTNNITLISSNLPPHSHTVTSPKTVQVSGTITGSMIVNNTTTTGTLDTPGNNYLGLEQGGNGLYEGSATTGKTLNAAAISVSNGSLGVNLSSLGLTYAGSNYPLNIDMPGLGMNYIICIYGIFPSRN